MPDFLSVLEFDYQHAARACYPLNLPRCLRPLAAYQKRQKRFLFIGACNSDIYYFSINFLLQKKIQPSLVHPKLYTIIKKLCHLT